MEENVTDQEGKDQMSVFSVNQLRMHFPASSLPTKSNNIKQNPSFPNYLHCPTSSPLSHDPQHYPCLGDVLMFKSITYQEKPDQNLPRNTSFEFHLGPYSLYKVQRQAWALVLLLEDLFNCFEIIICMQKTLEQKPLCV